MQTREDACFDDRYLPYAPALMDRARELRREMTPAEHLFWEAVRGRRFRGLKFRRQKPLLEFIADFYCAELRLVVEIDGGIHEETLERDYLRSEELATLGITVVRYTNEEVMRDIACVLSHLSLLVDRVKRDDGEPNLTPQPPSITEPHPPTPLSDDGEGGSLLMGIFKKISGPSPSPSAERGRGGEVLSK